MQAASQLRVEDLLSQLPGTLRRGHVPEDREREWGSGGSRGDGSRLSTGYPEIDDLLGGGVPRGRLSELVSNGSAGATSLAQRLLSGVTTGESLAAWVDLADAFDPASASAAGVALHRLLWVRPPDLVAAFSAAEMLLTTGGFALVLLDVSRVGNESARGRQGGQGVRRGDRRKRGPVEKGRRMLTAPQTWLRLARAAERSQTALVVLGRGRSESGARSAGLAGSAAGVRLELSTERAVWEGSPGAPSLLEGLVTRIDVTRSSSLLSGLSGQSGRPGPQRHGSKSRRAHICLDRSSLE